MDIRTYNPPPEREWAVESDSEFQPLFLLTHPKFFFLKADSGEFVILKICYFQLICLPTTLVKLIPLKQKGSLLKDFVKNSVAGRKVGAPEGVHILIHRTFYFTGQGRREVDDGFQSLTASVKGGR